MNASIYKLHNQASLLVIPLQYAQSATVMALVNAGPRFDPIGKEGLSHFVEHMLFRGTKKFPTRQELAADIERYGAVAGAFSFHEINKYWIKCPDSEIDIVIANLIDRLQNSLFKSSDIKEEKGVAQEELRILKSNPEKYIWDLWSEVCWPGIDLGRIYVGNKTSIENFSRSDVIKFAKNYYCGERTTYIVSGNVKPEKITAIFNKNVVGYSSKEIISRENKNVSLRKSNGICLSQSDTENVTVALGFSTVGYKSSDRSTLELLSAILSGSMNARLRKIMELGLVYSIEAYAEHLSDTGYFMVMFSTDKSTFSKVVSLVQKEFMALKQNLLDESELIFAKDYTKGAFKVNTETPYDFAEWYGNRFFLAGDMASFIARDSEIDMVTREDIYRVANRYFNDLKIATVGNISEKEIRLAIGDKI